MNATLQINSKLIMSKNAALWTNSKLIMRKNAALRIRINSKLIMCMNAAFLRVILHVEAGEAGEGRLLRIELPILAGLDVEHSSALQENHC
jgi:hypothetical protein